MKKLTKLIREQLHNNVPIHDVYTRVIQLNPNYRHYRVEEEFVRMGFKARKTNEQILSEITSQVNLQVPWDIERIEIQRQIWQGTYITPAQRRAGATQVIPVGTRPRQRRSRRNVTSIMPEFDFDPKRTFGIEIEFTHPDSVSIDIIMHEFRNQNLTVCMANRSDSRRNAWKFTNDCSVRATVANYIGGKELVSPILKGEEGFEEIRKVSAIFKRFRCKVNSSCGLHVHHGVMFHNIKEENVWKFFKNVLYTYHNYRHQLGSILPHSRRQGGNGYCRNMKYAEISRLKGARNITELNFISADRRRVVNLDSWFKYKTIEFRQHSGTFDAMKIISWIKINQAILKKAADMVQTDTNPFEYSFKRYMEDELQLKQEIKDYIKARRNYFHTTADTQVAE